MRNIAIGICLVIFLSFLVEPMVEIVNVTVEKIKLDAALSNAARAAKDRALLFERQRSLDAEIDPDRFIKYFSEAFEHGMNVKRLSASQDMLVFTSEDGKYNDIIVTLQFLEKTDIYTEQMVSEVIVRAETEYKFKTKYLKYANDTGGNVGYQLKGERNLVLSVKN